MKLIPPASRFAEQVRRAQMVQEIIRANGIGITGRMPHSRYQLFTRASEPLVDPDFIRLINRRYQLLYGGEPAVVNPSRLMRVFGSIAWPYNAERVVGTTSFETPKDGRRMFRSAPDAFDVLSKLKERGASLHMIDLGGDTTGNGVSTGLHHPRCCGRGEP